MSNFVDTDYSLIRRLTSRDVQAANEAWNCFVALYEKPMIEYVKLKKGGSDSEDIVQETLFKLYKILHAGKYQPQGNCKFHSYLCIMMHNILRDYQRNNRKGENLADEMAIMLPEKFDSDQGLEMDEDWHRTLEKITINHVLSLNSLSQKSRAIYREVVLESQGLQDVCKRYKLSHKEVTRICKRIQMKIDTHRHLFLQEPNLIIHFQKGYNNESK